MLHVCTMDSPSAQSLINANLLLLIHMCRKCRSIAVLFVVRWCTCVGATVCTMPSSMCTHEAWMTTPRLWNNSSPSSALPSVGASNSQVSGRGNNSQVSGDQGSLVPKSTECYRDVNLILCSRVSVDLFTHTICPRFVRKINQNTRILFYSENTVLFSTKKRFVLVHRCDDIKMFE